jgi:Arc/MetJ-type ribon-helix-helix transcriptional regulator
MVAAKVAVTLDAQLLADVDRWVAEGEFPNRSKAIQAALEQLRQSRSRQQSLLAELAKLDPDEERSLADEVFTADTAWPTY